MSRQTFLGKRTKMHSLNSSPPHLLILLRLLPQTKLEAEFNVIQKTRAGTLESTDAGDTTARFGSTILGTEGMPFKFADHPNQPVEFIPFVAVDTQAKAPADSSSDSHDTKRIFKWLAQHE
jgi:hypothetical protein